MTASAHPDLVAEMLLRFYRHPGRYGREMKTANEASGSLETVVRFALGRDVAELTPGFRIGVVARELNRAALFFLHHALFHSEATHYQLLGLQRDAHADSIRENHRLLIQVVHPDRGDIAAPWPPGVAARVNRAYAVLRDADARERYDAEIAKQRRGDSQSSGSATGASRADDETSAPLPMPGTAQPTFAVVRAIVPRVPLRERIAYAFGDFARTHPRLAALSFAFSLAAFAVGAILWLEDARLPLTFDLTYDLNSHDGALRRVQPQVPPPTDFDVVKPVWTVDPKKAGAQPLVPALSVMPPATAAPPALSVMPPATAAPPALQLRPLVTASATASSTATEVEVIATRPPATQPPATALRPMSAATPASQTLPAVITAPALAVPMVERVELAVPTPRVDAATTTPVIAAAPIAPARSLIDGRDIEAMISAFTSHLEAGRPDALAAWLAADARVSFVDLRTPAANVDASLPGRRHVERADWRWSAREDRTRADGDLAVRYPRADGREASYRLAVEMDLVRRNGRTVISRLAQQLGTAE